MERQSERLLCYNNCGLTNVTATRTTESGEREEQPTNKQNSREGHGNNDN